MLKSLAADKAMHLILSVALFAIAAFAAKHFGRLLQDQVAIGAIAAGGIGLAKEIVWDKAFGRGTPDAGDLAADLAGIALGACVYIAGAV